MSTVLSSLCDIAQEVLDGTWEPTANLECVYGKVHFDMGHWVDNAEEGMCGTAACIVGHGLLDQRVAHKLRKRPPTTSLNLGPDDDYARIILEELGVEHSFTMEVNLKSYLFMPKSYRTDDDREKLELFIHRARKLMASTSESITEFLESYSRWPQ